MSTWKRPPDPNANLVPQTPSATDDPLLRALADVQFEESVPQPLAMTAPTSQPVPPLPVHAVDVEEQAVHDAVQAGVIPTFSEAPTAASPPTPNPIDVAAEVDAYRTFLALARAHAAPGTEITCLDPDAYAMTLV